MIWVAGRSPTLVSQNLKATTLTYLAILWRKAMARPYSYDLRQKAVEAVLNGAKLVEVSE